MTTTSPNRSADDSTSGRHEPLRGARGNTAFTYCHDVAGRQLMQTGVDNGERRVLPNGSGKPTFVWTGAPVAGDAPYRLRHEYDFAERPTHVWLSNDGGTESLRSYVVYGEDASGDPEDLNLRTRVWRTFDTAGLVESTGFDFKGNAIGSTRRLIVSNDTDPDWSAVAAAATLEDADDEADLLLESAAYTTATT